ncbi:MAG: PAS domain S-box protein, partial [Pseudomonadota bacterium]|nr:PAS domain S-box protein [Pseudomonadota bacterium]
MKHSDDEFAPRIETNASILLVDDSPSELVALHEMLSNFGPVLVDAHSGEDAIWQLKTGEFAVVLLRVRMSGMTGFETAQAIRSDARLRHTPIIFLADENTEPRELEQAYNLGAVDFLAKPLIPVVLKSKLSVFIDLFEKSRLIRQSAIAMHASEPERSDWSLVNQQEWMRITLPTFRDAVITTDALERVTFLNPVAQELTGWTEEEALGKRIDFVFHTVDEQNRKQGAHSVGQALSDGIRFRRTNRTVLVAKNGSERPIDDSASPIRNTAGEIIGNVLIFRDVTEQKNAERNVWQSKASRSAMLEMALDCIISMDHEGRVIEFNPAAEKTFGYRRADVIGQELASLIIPPSLRDRHRRGMAHYLATGEGPVLGKRLELSALRADGTEFPVELAITRIPTDGPPLFTAYLRDISEQKHAERQLEDRVAERTAELARANEFLKALLENVQTGVVACDATGVLTLFNSVTRALHGLPEEPLPPDQWAARYRLYRPDGKTPMAMDEVPLFRALNGEWVHDAEMVIAPTDMPPRTVLTSGQSFFDAQGEKLG